MHRTCWTLLRIVVAAALLVAGCARKRTDAYQGYIEGKFVYVAAPVSGRLEHLAVARGETIAAGSPLFNLDHEPEASAQRQAQRLMSVAESRLADLQLGKRPEEIAVARAQLAQALAEKQEAGAILASDEAQFRAGGIAQTELIQAQGALDTSTARVKELEADLAVDALPARAEQIRAQADQVAADRATVAQSAWTLGQKDVSSPRQGLIFDTLYREGEWVADGNPVVQILPPENLELRFFVPESIVGKLRIRQSIRVQCDGCAPSLQATIRFISPQAEYTPPVIYSNENRSKLVFLVIAKPSAQEAQALHPGQPIEVTLP
ncbi:MAG: HlyD family efflux transporter periplasmic adaptor subunit [Terracidiphilus sp.]